MIVIVTMIGYDGLYIGSICVYIHIIYLFIHMYLYIYTYIYIYMRCLKVVTRIITLQPSVEKTGQVGEL